MQSGLKPIGRENWWVFVLLLPTLVGLLFGVFGSLFATLGISLLEWDLLTPPQWAGLDNYLGLLNDSSFHKALTTTTGFALMYVPSVIVLSLLLALLLNRKIRAVSLFRVLYFLPVVSSAVAVGLVWNWIYARDTGLLNSIIRSFGGQPVNWLTGQMTLVSIVIVNVWGAIGEGMIVFLAGLQAIPREYYEAAAVDGATARHQFRYITVPLITPEHLFPNPDFDH
ncbi:MAG: sugar ABC transporter permease [Anaerolineae bacterium]